MCVELSSLDKVVDECFDIHASFSRIQHRTFKVLRCSFAKSSNISVNNLNPQVARGSFAGRTTKRCYSKFGATKGDSVSPEIDRF